MSSFNHILFAGDLSERSRGAFGAACAMARGTGGHLHVLNVADPVLLPGPSRPAHGAWFPSILPGDTPAHRKEVEGELRAFYRADPPIAVDYLVWAGDAADEILRAADDVDADVIVVGTHCRSGVDRLICGSVAESVLRRSNRPVLIVRNPEAPRPDAPIRLILHPTDFSAHSRPALAVARALSRAHGAGLVLLHVAPAEILSGSAYSHTDVAPEREALARLQEECARAGLEGSAQVRFSQGDPVTEILLTADELGCDLIVMGSHGRTGLGRLLMGSVAESVIHSARCLTLIVKRLADRRAAVEGDEPSAAKDAGAVA